MRYPCVLCSLYRTEFPDTDIIPGTRWDWEDPQTRRDTRHSARHQYMTQSPPHPCYGDSWLCPRRMTLMDTTLLSEYSCYRTLTSDPLRKKLVYQSLCCLNCLSGWRFSEGVSWEYTIFLRYCPCDSSLYDYIHRNQYEDA